MSERIIMVEIISSRTRAEWNLNAGANAAGGIRSQTKLVPRSVKRLEPGLGVGQSDALAERWPPPAAEAPAVVTHLQAQGIGQPLPSNRDRAASFPRFDPVPDGIFHERLQKKWRNGRASDRRLNLPADLQPIAKTRFLNPQILT
jgi:hypothetical protein